jgi:hypothetical protein
MADIDEEYFLYVRRHMQFLHIWTMYFDLLSGRYVPSVGYTEFGAVETNSALPSHMVPTLMGLLYAFFYSLVEDSDDSINAFRIWRLKYPDEHIAIDVLEKRVAPMREDLRVFRNRIAFHGSRTYKHESRAYGIFGNQSGTKIIETMKVFKKLNFGLLTKNLALQHQSEDEMASARAVIDSIPTDCEDLDRM